MADHVRHTVRSVQTTSIRDGGRGAFEVPADDDIVELDLGEGISLFTGGGHELSQQLDAVPDGRDGSGILRLRTEGALKRGGSGIVLKAVKVLDVGLKDWLGIGPIEEHVASVIADRAAELADNRDIAGRSDGPGLYQCDAQHPYAHRRVEAKQVSPNGEALVLVHGFFSNTAGAFDGLWQPSGCSTRDALLTHYNGAVYGFDHATLADSPVTNAVALARTLPKGASLHMLAHSRGGLICELMSRAQFERTGFIPREIDCFAEQRPQDADGLRELVGVMKERQLRVTRLVRAGSPIRGTWLASNRLDRWLSIFYNVVRQAVPIGPQFVADTVFDVLAAVIKKRLEPAHFAGIEAMCPTSPLMVLLNDIPAPVDQRLTVIAGDCVGSGLLNRLKVLITDGFHGERHDLVVPTSSMFGGAQRTKGTRYFFHQTPRVDHFHYFSQSESLQRIKTGLIGDEGQYGALQLLTAAKERRLVANRAIKPDAPLNVVLPGIMGTDLHYRNDDRLWIDVAGFACGKFPRLALDADTQDKPYPSPGTQAVYPLMPADDFYGDLIERIQERGEKVLAAGYDWRKPIHVAADALAARLESEWPEGSARPLRLIAHSMGGLVARSLFARHPKLRDRFVRSPHNRLLMLGTPNQGSIAIARALLRDNKQIALIAAIAPQSQTELLSVAATFPGFHELLPPHGRIWAKPSVWETLYRQRGIAIGDRPELSVEAMTLAERGRQALRGSIGAIPKTQTIYVAGFVDPDARDATVVDISDDGSYLTGPGDGTVSYESGLIDGVTTYYANARHGDLPKYKKAFEAYFQLLNTGQTALLVKDWRTLQEARRGVQLEALEMEQLPYRPSRREMFYSLLGATTQDAAQLQASRADPIQLRVVNGGLRFARYPLIVGHYQGDLMAGSESEVNRQFGGQMQTALELGVYVDAVETFQVFERNQPTDDKRSPFAVVVGLGRRGELSVGDLRRTVRRGILGWFGTTWAEAKPGGRPAFSVVLLGSSVSGMSVAECARAILLGVLDAQQLIVDRLQATDSTDNWQCIADVEFIELYEDKALELVAELRRLTGTDELCDQFKIRSILEERDDALRRLRDDSRSAVTARRLDIHASGNSLRYSLPGIQAAVPVMKRNIDVAEIQAYAREIDQQLSTDRTLGRVLFNQLLPLELKRFALEQYDLLLTLNESAASLPWELADAGAKLPLSVQSGMIRQLSSASYTPRERVSSDSALVIGEPIVEGLSRLPGALREAELVAEVLRSAGFDVTHLERPTALQVRDALGARPYRLIHFSGHGVVDDVSDATEAALPRTGMVIGSLPVSSMTASSPRRETSVRGASDERGAAGARADERMHWLLLTPEDIRECVAQVPEMVFINCCHLGRQTGVARNAPKMASNLANSFMEIGCRAVIAAGWAVEDAAALCFADELYRAMVMHQEPFISAVRLARWEAYRKHGEGTPTWGAYQCYGDPSYSALRQRHPSADPDFSMPRELAAWLREQDKHSIGLHGDAVEPARIRLKSVLERVDRKWLDCDEVFENAIRAAESMGSYVCAATLIQDRIDRRLIVAVPERVLHARLSLRLAMQSAKDMDESAQRWYDTSVKALSHLKKIAELEGSDRLWYDLGTYLRRLYILQTTDPGRTSALIELLEATVKAWKITRERTLSRIGESATQDAIMCETTDEQAQKTLAAIIVARSMPGREAAALARELPDFNTVLLQCQEKIKRSDAAAEFWDEADQSDLELLMLVARPDWLPAGTQQRTATKYEADAASIATRYAFAMRNSATEAFRDSIAAYVRFWYDVATQFSRYRSSSPDGHWALVRYAMVKANLHGVPHGAKADLPTINAKAKRTATRAAPERRRTSVKKSVAAENTPAPQAGKRGRRRDLP